MYENRFICIGNQMNFDLGGIKLFRGMVVNMR